MKVGEKVTVGRITGIIQKVHKAECAIDVETADGQMFRVSGLCWNDVNEDSPTATYRTARGKMPTYAQARQTLLAYLAQHGWSVRTDLKVPHATSPYGDTRLWFKAQAVYIVNGPPPHKYEHAHTISYDLDIRKLTPEEFLHIAGF